MPTDLHSIRTFKQLVRYLEHELDWPLEGYDMEDLTFDYEPDELGLKPGDAAKVKSIRQLRPLDQKQPWGIFFIEFDRKKLPVVVLRRILSHLVVKKRASANQADRAAWSAEDLLFISAFGAEDEDGREITFAHFHQEDGDLPTLRVLGWDGGDTPLKFEHLQKTLKERLHWPDTKESLDAWRARWAGVFRHRVGHIINTSDMLAEAMAGLARRIRDAAQTLIERETEKGPLRKLHEAFKTHLIHDLTEEGFADTYAQTITYGLLTAAISRTEMSAGKHGTALVASNVTDMVPVTNPFLKEMLQTFLQVGGRKGGIDFDELGVQDVVELLRGEETDLPAILRDFGNKTRGEDPVLHFYEHFLNAYNKQLRIQRGVFYTPQPVVSYIVRSVHELLQTEFGLEHGLADTTTWGEMIQHSKSNIQNSTLTLPPLTDEPGCKETISPDEPFVQILDPATGTATFLVEVIDVIHKHLQALWKKGGAAAMPSIPNSKSNIQNWSDFWNAYVPKALLPRLHAYELMMAPYAIAHMKIGLKLAETGYRFGTEERARIYLTNALEPWVKQLPLIGLDALAHEAEEVNKIKKDKRFTVVIGNPPYSGISSNMSEYAQHIVDAYKFVDGAALNEKKLWLQDDYVKFIRKAQTTIDCTKVGVFGYITNHSYLDNPTFRGMRQSLMGTFPSFRAFDLHGNTTRAEHPPDGIADKNVFDIQQGVAVCLATRGGSTGGVEHADLWGTREAKYSWLAKHSVANSGFAALAPDSPYYFFEPQNIDCRAEYDSGWKINEAMPLNCAGFITARDHFVVDLDKEALLERIGDFANLKKTDADIRATHFAGCGSDKYPDGDTRGWKVPEARRRVAGDKKWKERVRICSYRPFDERSVYWADWMVDWPRPEVSGHMLAGSNVAFHVCRQSVSEAWAHILVARGLIDDCYVSNKSRERGYAHPLYLYESDGGLAFGNHGEPNFAHAFLRQLASALNLPQAKPHNLPRGLTPEDIFHYAYAVFHSPGYRSRYAEFLKIDFPRLPLTGNLELFRALARLGGELTALHLLESPMVANVAAVYDRRANAWRMDTGDRKTSDGHRPPLQLDFTGPPEPVIEKPTWSDDTVWVDKKQTIGFRGVPEAVWNFHIGGYQVCQKWLKDRKGRTLTDEDIAHYHKIVIALSETIRLMAEIDQVIESHGGWPGAFAGNAK